MVVLTSRKFYDRFTDTGGGGTDFPNFRVLDRGRVEIEGYFAWGIEDEEMTFNAAGKTITLTNTALSWFVDGEMRVGDTFDIVNTASNNGSYTVASIDENILTTVEALVNETVTCSAHGTTTVSSVDFRYNSISGNAIEDYFSLQEPNSLQQYTYASFDATDATAYNMTAVGRSQSWNGTHSITIEGEGITSYRQKFKIIHQFRVTPMWLAGQDVNFSALLDGSDAANEPLYFPMKYVNDIKGRYDAENPNPVHEIDDTEQVIDTYRISQGNIGWFNLPPSGTPDYTLTSISCNSSIFDLNIETTWTAVINSAGAKFDTGSKIQLAFFRCAKNETEYQYKTNDLFKVMHFDEAFIQVGSTGNGTNYGGDYQVLKDVAPVKDSDSQITITFKINLSTFLKDFLKDLEPDDRNFAIAITTQDPAITTTAGVDRVAILAEFENFGWNQDDLTAVELVDYIRVFNFPNLGTDRYNNIAGYLNEPIYVDVPFRIRNDEGILSAGVEIVAFKSGEDDFILESKTFNLEEIRVLDGKQDFGTEFPKVYETRGYNTRPGDFYNEAYLKLMPAYDTGSHYGALIHYGFVLRYEDWINAVSESDANSYEVFRTIESTKQYWYNFTQEGWGMKLRVRIIRGLGGSSGVRTTYIAETGITLADFGETTTPAFECQTKFYDEDGEELNAIEKDAKTKIVATFTGDFSSLPAGFTDPAGMIRIDIPDIGSSLFSKFACPHWDSEEGSPFSSEGITAGAGATDSYASANMRIDVYGTERVVLSTFYDDSIDRWGDQTDSFLVMPLLTFKGETTDCPILNEITKVPLLHETNYAILNEDC